MRQQTIRDEIAMSSAKHLEYNSHLYQENGYARWQIDDIIENIVERDSRVRRRFLGVLALGETVDLNFRWSSPIEVLRHDDRVMGLGSTFASIQAFKDDSKLERIVMTHFSFNPDNTGLIAPIIGYGAGVEHYENIIARAAALDHRLPRNPTFLLESLGADLTSLQNAEDTLDLIEHTRQN